MITRRVFTFLKNFVVFFIDRLYKEWEYMIEYGRSYSERASERGDLYAKHIIENIIHDRVSKYDPYILDENATISYRRTSLGLGKARLTGLSSLHRTNICSLTEIGNRFFINANLGAGPITYRRQIEFRFGELERKAVVLVLAKDIKVSVDFSVEKETGRNGFLLNFFVNELNGFKLSVTGFGCFDGAINLFLSFWTFVFRRIVRNLLENELEQYVLKRLPKYQFPVEAVSCGNEAKLDSECEGAQNDEASPPESFQMKQSYRKQPKRFRSFPIDESGMYDSRDSEEYVGSSMETANSFRFSPDASTQSSGIKGCYLPASYCTNSFSEVFGERVDVSGSLNQVTERSDSADADKLFKETILKNCSLVLEDFELFDSSVSGKLYTVESNGRGGAVTSTSFAMGFENEQPILAGERRNLDENVFDMGNKLPVRVDKSDSIPSPKSESPETDKNVLESSIAEFKNFPSPSHNLNCKVKDKKTFAGMKRKREAEYSHKKPRVSVLRKSPKNLNFNMRNTQMNKNELLVSCAADTSIKHLNVVPEACNPEYKSETEDSESRKSNPLETITTDQEMPEISCISKPEGVSDSKIEEPRKINRIEVIFGKREAPEISCVAEPDVSDSKIEKSRKSNLIVITAGDQEAPEISCIAEPEDVSGSKIEESRKSNLIVITTGDQEAPEISCIAEPEDVNGSKIEESRKSNLIEITAGDQEAPEISCIAEPDVSDSKIEESRKRAPEISCVAEPEDVSDSDTLDPNWHENSRKSTPDMKSLSDLQEEILANIKRTFNNRLSDPEELNSNLNLENPKGESICDDVNQLQEVSITNLEDPLQISSDNLCSAERLPTPEVDSEKCEISE